MPLPAEILRLLAAEPQAHAALNCSLGGPIGETHLVVAGGRLAVFTRESLIGEFMQVALDPHRAPLLERGDFADTLHVNLADGATVDLNVSSFERDDLIRTLAAAKPAPSRDISPSTALLRPAETSAAAEALVAPPQAGAVAPATSAGQAPAVTEAKEEADPQAGKSAARYHSNDIGCGTCLLQCIFLLTPALGMWLAQDPAMQAIGAAEGSAMDWVTEVLAIIGGLYMGYKALGLIARVSRTGNWQGYVEVKGDIARIVGPRGKWTVVIDGRRPYTVACHMLKKESQAQDKSSTIKPSYNYFVRIEQDGRAALLHSHERPEVVPTSIASYPLEPVEAEIKDPQSMLLSICDLRFVAARLRDLPRLLARSRSAGDNRSA